jgi:hypothetical protein
MTINNGKQKNSDKTPLWATWSTTELIPDYCCINGLIKSEKHSVQQYTNNIIILFAHYLFSRGYFCFKQVSPIYFLRIVLSEIQVLKLSN